LLRRQSSAFRFQHDRHPRELPQSYRWLRE